MKRALIASTLVLTAVLGFLVWRRLVVKPEPPPVAAEAVVPPAPEAASAAKAEEHHPPVEVPKEDVRKVEAAPQVEPADGAPAERGRTRPGPRLPVLRKGSAAVAASPNPPPATVRLHSPAAPPRQGWRDALPGPLTRASWARPAGGPAAGVAARGAGAVSEASAVRQEVLPGAVSGTLRTSSGVPVPGASVLAVASGGGDAFETVTDDDGFYLLAAMKPGRYLMFAGLDSSSPSRLPARSIQVPHGVVARVELREPSAGATVRVRALQANGRPASGQAVLVAGPVASPATLPALLSSDTIFLPEPGVPNVLRHVPAGVYTLVILQGETTPPRVVRRPITVRGEAEQQVEVWLPDDVAVAGHHPDDRSRFQ